MPTAAVLGVHPVETDEPCHLVELVVSDSDGPVDVADITQADDAPRSEWQVPYAEKVLTPDGSDVAHDLWEGPGPDSLWAGDVRLAFYFHHLDPSKALTTPWGDLPLPSPSPTPTRLGFLTYEQP